MADAKSLMPFPKKSAGGTDSEAEHPCDGCLYYYSVYKYNRCCNYYLDTGKRRPCPAGEGCTVKRPITCKKDLKLRKGIEFY